jgi:hypothetical protein
MRETDWSKVLGWPGYQVYQHEIDEKANAAGAPAYSFVFALHQMCGRTAFEVITEVKVLGTLFLATQPHLAPKLYANLRQQVLRRDGWRCQSCGAMSNLDVHHRNLRSQCGDDSEQNLITLCPACHSIVHCGTKPNFYPATL